MALLTRKQFEELADYHSAHCVSIFMPTERAGEEVNKGHFRIVYEKHLKEAQQQLREYGLNDREIEDFMEPAAALAKDSGFWRNQSDGLAVFLSKDRFDYFTLPVRFEEFNYVADHFYLRPLMPLFNENGRFFILSLTLHGAQLYEATPHSLTEVYIEDLTPARLEEVVGYDYEERSLQWHSMLGQGQSGAMYHGQGRQDDKRKEEILQYCRAVNKGLMDQILYDLDEPLVVASVEFMFPMFKKVNTYKNLVEEPVAGNPAGLEPTVLHERAWEKVRPVFEAKREEKKKLYDELAHTDRTSYELEEIVPAAIDGRVDTLFIRNREDAYGTFHRNNNRVEVDDEKEISNASLLNLAAVKTFLQKGTVYLMESDEMPEEDTLVNAVFRYGLASET